MRAAVRACEVTERAVELLRDLKASKRLLELCVEINLCEDEADIIYRNGIASLYNAPADLLFVMKWRDIYDQLELTTNRCEEVANIIEGVVLEHA